MANPDTILYNGVIYPRPATTARAQAIAIWNGFVTDVGKDTAIQRLKARSVKMVNLQGRTVIPGLIDSHIHLLSYGMISKSLDLQTVRSITELQRAVKKRAAGSSDAWILGRGWDQERLREHRFPTRKDLDVTSKPVFLRRVCGHVAVANSAALSISGIDSSTPDPSGGVIERDDEKVPTGILEENALGLVQEKIPRDEGAIQEALISGSIRLLKLGLTSLQCVVSDMLEFKILRRLKLQGRIKQSIYAILPLDALREASALGLSTEKGPGGFRVGGVKLFLDGSLGARTAALNEPYSDSPTAGMLTMEREEVEHEVESAVKSGFQLAIHAIGDRAVDLAVDVLSKANREKRSRELRHRIEHASVVSPEKIPMMNKNGIIASVQPPFVYTDSWAEERLGKRRLHNTYPFQTMLKKGVSVSASSDSPAANPNPFLGVWSAVRRPGFLEDERLSVSQALGLYTEGSAFASFSENYQGALEPGMRADLIVLNKDPFKCSMEVLRTVHATRTMIGGEFVG